ncbi:hypothetical protein L2Y96_20890 [Luteibacter aegosomaticola]|uniref:hypothetical protein n=1 Tax=Luteibacter aegosomaticola TaxID=2911538 RepID=UPI001FF87AE4|nr:hypothetical protein [Luteibacter aegosomaticola]UPG89815.1 hypothetical protein L2Y96_20890 [Luteibacter aegosomaticola]
MASIFTGLAFMHGHIVNKELILALGGPDADRGVASPARSALASDTSKPRKRQAEASSLKVPVGCCNPDAACC